MLLNEMPRVLPSFDWFPLVSGELGGGDWLAGHSATKQALYTIGYLQRVKYERKVGVYLR